MSDRLRRHFVLPDGSCHSLKVCSSVWETIDRIMSKRWMAEITRERDRVRLWFDGVPLDESDEIPSKDQFFFVEVGGVKSSKIGFRCFLPDNSVYTAAFNSGTTVGKIKSEIAARKKVEGIGKLVLKSGQEVLPDDCTIDDLTGNRRSGDLITLEFVKEEKLARRNFKPKGIIGGPRIFVPKPGLNRKSKQTVLPDLPARPKFPAPNFHKNKQDSVRSSFGLCQKIPLAAFRTRSKEPDEDDHNMAHIGGEMPIKFNINGENRKIKFPTNVSIAQIKERICSEFTENRQFKLTFRGRVLEDDDAELGSIDGFLNSSPIDVIIEAKTEEDEPLLYRFRVPNQEEPLELRFKVTDTVEVAKAKIAKACSAEPDDVDILFVGKILNNRLILSRLRIPDDAVIPVYVQTNEPVLIATCKALQIKLEYFPVRFVIPKKPAVMVDVANELTITEVKRELGKAIECDPERIDLIFAGKLLDNESSVGDIGVTSESEILASIMQQEVADLARTFGSSCGLEEEDTDEIDAYEEALFAMISVSELKRLRRAARDRTFLSDAELIVTYIRYGRNFQLVREHLDREYPY